jgi:hypothetical protein
MLPDNSEEDIPFFGGKDYLPLSCSLTGFDQSPEDGLLHRRRMLVSHAV